MIDLALVGAGTMGTNHARVAMGLRDARLTVIVDSDEGRGRVLADKVGARYVPTVEQAIGAVDAAIVATPTPFHHPIGVELLDAGVHLLIEKPLARTREEAMALIEAADVKGLVLMVGHTERFNPAVLELDHLVSEPIHISTQRISPYTPHIADGVTLDLMIHDLDLVASIAKSPLESVSAVSRDVFGEDDLSVALLRFANGVTACLTASRLGQDKVREMTITQRAEFLRIDLIRQAVTVHRLGQIAFVEGEVGFRQSGIVEVPFLTHRGEPLLLELGHFVDAVKSNTQPRVTGADGLRAMEMAEDVRRAARRT